MRQCLEPDRWINVSGYVAKRLPEIRHSCVIGGSRLNLKVPFGGLSCPVQLVLNHLGCRTVAASPSGSSMAEALGNAFRLNGDRHREGQEAFTASPFSRLLITHVLSLAGDALVTLALAGSLFFSTPLHAARGKVALTLLLTIAPFGIV